MITSLRLKNFKNFADETLKLGPFTVIVGANASGKSNIRDAFRFLHGIGRGYTLAEIIGGKIGSRGQTEWEPLRGAPEEVARFEPRFPNSMHTFSIHAASNFQAFTDETARLGTKYAITVDFAPIGPGGFRILEETFETETANAYRTMQGDDGLIYHARNQDDEMTSRFDQAKPVLSQLSQHAIWLPELLPARLEGKLLSTRFVEFLPERMKEPSVPGANVLGDSGQNLGTALASICADSDRKHLLTSWLRELTPMDVQDFKFPRAPNGRIHLHLVERNGREISADSASDGTLRFLGMLALLLNDRAEGAYFFEDIDTGIHPSRLRLLVELIESQTAKGNIQVITTTHSPALLAWMNDETFENTSVIYRDEHWQDSVIRPIADLYDLRELRKSKGLEWLLTSDWLDNAMHFSEGGSDTDDDNEDVLE